MTLEDRIAIIAAGFLAGGRYTDSPELLVQKALATAEAIGEVTDGEHGVATTTTTTTETDYQAISAGNRCGVCGLRFGVGRSCGCTRYGGK